MHLIRLLAAYCMLAADRAVQIHVSRDIQELDLPREAITVAAWVRVDKPLEWGGVVGVIQDNGRHERGWLLGYHNLRSCFAVKSSNANQLTLPYQSFSRNVT